MGEMMSEVEVRRLRDVEVERLDAIVDIDARWVSCQVINILNEVLNE